MALITVGWREWIALPDIGIDHIKAKIDTGARTSCLHAFSQERFTQAGAPWIRFGMHPLQRGTDIEVFCEAEIVDERMVSDSGGHRELRPIIRSTIDLGVVQFLGEFSLTNRDSMRFRVLLGRTAMAKRLIVDPSKSFLLKKKEQ